jgi:hypothetical protein
MLVLILDRRHLDATDSIKSIRGAVTRQVAAEPITVEWILAGTSPNRRILTPSRRTSQTDGMLALSRHMRITKIKVVQATLLFWSLLITGCVSNNVNPATAARDTGYVEFFTAKPRELSWDVRRFDGVDQRWITIYNNFEPVHERALRIPLRPGNYLLEVRINNVVTDAPGRAKVEIKEGMVTPVLVELQSLGKVSRGQKEVIVKPTVRGTDRGAKVSEDEPETYRIIATPRPPVPYQPIEQMEHR